MMTMATSVDEPTTAGSKPALRHTRSPHFLLPAATVVISVAAMITIAAVLVDDYQQRIREQTQHAVMLVAAKAEGIRQHLARLETIAGEVSGNPAGLSRLEAYQRGELPLTALQQDTRMRLRAGLNRHPELIGFIRLDARGNLIVQIGDIPPGDLLTHPPSRHSQPTAAFFTPTPEEIFLSVEMPLFSSTRAYLGTDIALFQSDTLRRLVAPSDSASASIRFVIGYHRNNRPMIFPPGDRSTPEDHAIMSQVAQALTAVASGLRHTPGTQATTVHQPLNHDRWVLLGHSTDNRFAALTAIAAMILLAATAGAASRAAWDRWRRATAPPPSPPAGEHSTPALRHQLALAQERIAVQQQEMERFTSAISHDLKAPVRAIANLAAWILEDLDGQLEGESANHLNLLRGRVERLERLIDAATEYSRANRKPLRIETIDTGAAAREAWQALSPPHSFTLNVADNMPAIRSDRQRVRKIFTCLLDNAVKFHHSNQGRIDINGTQTDDATEICISDDGPGIAPQHHDRVMTLFQSMNTPDAVHCAGLGLPLVKRLIEYEGGAIVLASDGHNGTTITLRWPKESQHSQHQPSVSVE